MPLSDPSSSREQIEQAIVFQESLRGQVDDAIIDASIAALKEKLAVLDSSPEQQRKLATILFVDIANHTILTRGMDPEDQMALIDPLIARLAEKVREFGGHVARYQGDGFKAVFGLPLARENDPEQAIRAGLAIQGEAEVIAAELETEHGIAGLKVRVGITSGQVFAGGETEGEDTIKGPPVNLAARLESAAEPGTVLISYDTYKFVRGIFDLEHLEPIQVKGFVESVQVYKVQRAKPRAFYRGMRLVEGVETRMIGREAELDSLKDAFYTVLEDGVSQVVTITGEAGIGKSRLLSEFENWADLQPEGVRLFRGRAYFESRRIPYDLLRSIFAFRFNIQDNDPLEIVQEKWITGFTETSQSSHSVDPDSDMEMRAHILGQLLGYDFSDSRHVKPVLGEPQQMRDRSMVYLEGYFKAAAREMPVLLLLEDLHWADDSSLDALSRLGLELRETSILIVGAARPELYERRPYWFEGRDFHRRVDLKPLSRRINRQLVAEVLQKVTKIPDTLSKLIIANAEGNPFYVEELVKVLIEAGVIITGELNWMVDEDQLEKTDIPSTLTGVLQARLERLPKEERILIQQASVVGRIFWDQAVWYMNHQGTSNLEEPGVQEGLSILREREMIYRRELSAFLDAQEYIFKHAVLREVTYESVLKKLRKVYHSLAAEWLMEQRADRSSEVVGLIADHLELAGERDEAFRYLELAGAQAAEKYANDEAIDYFTRALALVPGDELETRFDLLLSREEVLELQAKREAQRLDLEALELLVEELTSQEKELQVATRWSQYYWMISDFQACAVKAEDVLSKAELIENSFYTAWGHLMWGRAAIRMNQYQIARKHLKQALDDFVLIGDKRMEGYTLRSLGMVAGALGDFQGWQDYSQEALSIARQIGNIQDEAEAINHLAHIFFILGDYSTAQSYFKQYLASAREIGSKNQERMACSNLAWIANSNHEYETALDYAMKALDIALIPGNQLGEADALINIGKAHFGLEMFDKAEDAFLQAFDLYRKIGVEWGIAESHTGLAKTKFTQGEIKGALTYVDAILVYLEKGKGDIQYHISVISYLICLQVLSAVGDSRYAEVLAQGFENLHNWAAKITDPDMRKSYLENVPWNRELVKLWEEQQDK